MVLAKKALVRGGDCIIGVPAPRDFSLRVCLRLQPSGLGVALGEALPSLVGLELSEPLVRSESRPPSPNDFVFLSDFTPFPNLVDFGNLTLFCYGSVFARTRWGVTRDDHSSR